MKISMVAFGWVGDWVGNNIKEFNEVLGMCFI